MRLSDLPPAALQRLLTDGRLEPGIRGQVERLLGIGGAAAAAVDAPARAPRKRKPTAPPRVEGLSSVHWTFMGAPRTKKNSAARLMHAGRPAIIPSEAWMAWRDECRRQVPEWLRLRDQPYNCAARFYRHADVGDSHGFYQGLADVLEECGVLGNDKWIRAWNGTDLLVDAAYPRVEFALTPL